MKIGVPVMILGIIGILLGGALYVAHYHHTIGEAGIALGVVLLIVGVALWMSKGKKAPPSTAPQ